MKASNSRWVLSILGPAAGFFAASLFAILISFAARSTTGISTLWVAESRGILAMNQADGGVQFELPVSGNARSVAVDAQHSTLWVFSDQSLQSYNLTGTPKTTTLLKPPKGNPAILTVDPQANRVWLGVQNQIYVFDGQGAIVKQLQLPQSVTDIALDRRKSRLWVAYKGTLVQYDQDGNQVQQLSTPGLKFIHALDYDVKLSQMWVAADDTVRRYTPDGSIAFSAQNNWFTDIGFIAADQQGGLWMANARQLANVNSAGSFNYTLAPYGGSNLNAITDLISNAKDHSAWIASQRRITHFAIDGTQTADFMPNLPDGKTLNVTQLALEVAPIAPQIQFTSPAPGSFLNNISPTLSVSYAGDDIDLSSLKFQGNGNPIATSCNTQANAATCTLSQPLSDGVYVLMATIANTTGNASQPAELQLTIDTVAPTITVTTPTNGFLTNQKSLSVLGRVSESAALTINGNPLGPQSLQFSYPTTLVEGANTFQLRAIDPAGNAGTAVHGIVLDTIPPPPPTASSIEAKPSGSQVSVVGKAGSVEGGSRVTVVNNDTGDRVTVTANADGGFSATLPGGSGDSIQIYSTDAATNEGLSTTVSVTGGGIFSGSIRFGTISPANGSTVNSDLVLVSVDLQAPPNTGVTINGLPAAALSGPSGPRYYANVPLISGANTITIVANAQDGRTATQTIMLTAGSPPAYTITPDPSEGVAPFNTTFLVRDNQRLGILNINIDFNNDGVPDSQSGGSSALITHTFTTTGLYLATFLITDLAGNMHRQVVTTIVMDPTVVDQTIYAIWNGMNASLLAGNVNGALTFLSETAQDTYAPVFTELLPQMPQILASYSGLQRSNMGSSYCEYGVNRVIDEVNRVFLIGFVRDNRGQWRVSSM